MAFLPSLAPPSQTEPRGAGPVQVTIRLNLILGSLRWVYCYCIDDIMKPGFKKMNEGKKTSPSRSIVLIVIVIAALLLLFFSYT